MPTSRDPVERFLEKFAEGDPAQCWEWEAYRLPGGYGRFGVSPREIVYAHRFSYEHFVGPIPDGLQIDHLCRNRSCVNPYHLEPVTGRENVKRGLKGDLVTHCPQGHEYDQENTSLSKGRRICRVCIRKRSTERYWRKRDEILAKAKARYHATKPVA